MILPDPLSILRGIKECLTEYLDRKHKSINATHNEVIVRAFKDLETIHVDYTKHLSKLRDNLVDESLPPRELIRWWRDTGLQLRHLRENVSSIEEDLKLFETKLPRGNDKEGNFYWECYQFAVSVLQYLKTTISPAQLSFYRDFEMQLSSVLSALESGAIESEVLKRIFYSREEVRDLVPELLTITDRVLPERWRNVSAHYRRVSAAAGHPSAVA